VLGHVRRAHRLIVHPALAYEQAGAPLHQGAEAMPAERNRREQPVHQHESGRGAQRRNQRCVAGDAAADDRPQHDAENDVEGRRPAQEALLAEPHDRQGHDEDDRRPQPHLHDAEIPALEADTERSLQPLVRAFHGASDPTGVTLTGACGSAREVRTDGAPRR
jgi:hypothetical protein